MSTHSFSQPAVFTLETSLDVSSFLLTKYTHAKQPTLAFGAH